MMTRFKVWHRNYEVDFNDDWDERRYLCYDYPEDEKWVVESVDGGHESYYATYEDAINSIYEGSK